MYEKVNIGTTLWFPNGKEFMSGLVIAGTKRCWIVKRAGLNRLVRVRKSDLHMPAHNGIGEGFWMTQTQMNRYKHSYGAKKVPKDSTALQRYRTHSKAQLAEDIEGTIQCFSPTGLEDLRLLPNLTKLTREELALILCGLENKL